MPTPIQFQEIKQPMRWNDAALKQLNDFKTLANQIDPQFASQASPTIISTHVSKSTTLPVVQITTNHLTIIIRDNFHDINAWIQSNKPITTPPDKIYPTRDFEWYKNELKRYRDYIYSDWTEEEINDPRILRVQRKNGKGWNTIPPDAKDCFTTSMTSTEWYSKYWSSATLLVDTQSENNAKNGTPYNQHTKFYRHDTCFAEGMTHLWHATPPPYRIGTQNFIIAKDNLNDIKDLINLIK